VSLFLALPSAWAGRSARLEYTRGQGAENCPDADVVRKAVAERIGYEALVEDAGETLVVHVEGGGSTLSASVRFLDAGERQVGRREIRVSGSDCAVLVDALALTISLTLDPSSAFRAPETKPAAPPKPAAPTKPVVPPSEAAASAAEPSASLRASVGAGAHVAAGVGPSAALGIVAAVGGRYRVFSLDLEGRADLPATGESTSPTANVRTWLLALSLAPCWHWDVFFGCAVASVGTFHAEAVDVTEPRAQHALWAAAGARAGAELGSGRSVALRAYAELLSTLTRHELTIDRETVYRLPPLSGGAGLVLAWCFP
jgi:hypothetical protein